MVRNNTTVSTLPIRNGNIIIIAIMLLGTSFIPVSTLPIRNGNQLPTLLLNKSTTRVLGEYLTYKEWKLDVKMIFY